jgi:hypothetical protein
MSDWSEEIYITDEVKAVVAKTATAMARDVFYFFGHIKEVSTRLQELTNSTTNKSKQFPCVILFTDIPVRENQPIGTYGTANLNLIIANWTNPKYTSQQRLDNNFKPILRPIKKEFIKQMSRHLQFGFPLTTEIQRTGIDRYFYGSTMNDKNAFNDYIDCIEIQNLQVIIKNKPC